MRNVNIKYVFCLMQLASALEQFYAHYFLIEKWIEVKVNKIEIAKVNFCAIQPKSVFAFIKIIKPYLLYINYK